MFVYHINIKNSKLEDDFVEFCILYIYFFIFKNITLIIKKNYDGTGRNKKIKQVPTITLHNLLHLL